MVAGIELGKEYAQICIKTESMSEPESITKVAGTENYRIPTEADLEDFSQLQELFRKLWKMIAPYGMRETVDYLVFCLEENSESMRASLVEISKIYNVEPSKVRFMDKQECFASYVMHQSAELLTHNSLLIENYGGVFEKMLLHKKTKTSPVVTEVRNISEKTLEDVFVDHGISSVFLVGDDFEEDWMKQNLKLLRNGRRVFAGKNLFVKGACYRAMDLLAATEDYIYLGVEKLSYHVAMKMEERGKEVLETIVYGGRNWYESNVSLEVLLLDEPVLEFAMIPINGKEKKTALIHLTDLPNRPKKTTRLRIELEFVSADCAKLIIKDLGFGEIFPRSEMTYEGELRWEQ